MNKYPVIKQKSLKEFTLSRADTFLGSTNRLENKVFIIKNNQIVKENICFSDALLQTVDELISNANDHALRTQHFKNKTTKIFVNVDSDCINVHNNGIGIPIKKENGIWYPELIFTKFLTSSNYDDDKKRYTGGRNGLGVKLSVMYAKQFELMIITDNKCYKQTYKNNLSTISKPIITNVNKQDQVSIVYYPDTKKFDNGTIDEIEPIIRKRVCDLVLFSDVNIYYNGNLLNPNKIDNLDYYVSLIPNITSKIVKIRCKNWDIAIFISSLNKVGNHVKFSMAFINGMKTGSETSTQLKYVRNKLIEKIIEKLPNKYYDVSKKDSEQKGLKKNDIQKILSIVVSATVSQPTFANQQKDKLTTKISEFESLPDFNDKNINKIFAKLNLKDHIINVFDKKFGTKNPFENKLKQTRNKRLIIDKYDPAEILKMNNSKATRKKCTLILTEGDSAKSTITNSLSKLKPSVKNYYGVYPLKGKPSNVMKAKSGTISKDGRLLSIIQILGLKINETYETKKSLDSLNYGSICIITDADVDGYHITTLIINFFQYYWPNLVYKHKGFITSLRTYILKILQKGKPDIGFYTEAEYNRWKKTNTITKSMIVKYYKGLGTSSTREFAEYLKNQKMNRVVYNDSDKSGKEYFNISCGSDVKLRKEWLSQFSIQNIDNIINNTQITYMEYINTLHIQFVMDDNIRSIPHINDGLKPSQRLILYIIRKLKINNIAGIKVNALGGKIISDGGYHHGDASINAAIIRMAQSFIGSNNIPLLEGIGGFGSRLVGTSNKGKGSASQPRYISVKLNSITNYIFREEDNCILKHKVIEGHSYEPITYFPIIPMALINEIQGIGTAYSTTIVSHDPIDVIDYIISDIECNKTILGKIRPYWRNFRCRNKTIIDDEYNRYIVIGDFKLNLEEGVLKIREIPPSIWIEDYKHMLESKYDKEILEFTQNMFDTKFGDDSHIEFTIFLTEEYTEKLKLLEKRDLSFEIQSNFKLIKTFSNTNMVLYNNDFKLQRYNTIYDIMDEFLITRNKIYKLRKKCILDNLMGEIDILNCKLLYIKHIRQNDIIIQSRNKTYNKKAIIANIYKFVPAIKKIDPSCGILTSMSIYSLTDEKYNEFSKKINEKQTIINQLLKKNHKEIWKDELMELRSKLIQLGY